MNSSLANPMEPHLATLVGIRKLATGIDLYQARLDDSEISAQFDYRRGQFAEVSAPTAQHRSPSR